MDRLSVGKILHEYAHYHNGELHIAPTMVAPFCDAITQAHEEERREDIKLIGRFANRIAEYEAQMAVMAEALRGMVSAGRYFRATKDGHAGYASAYDKAESALQSAPTVLWRGILSDDGWDRPGFFDAMLGNREVIVLECSVNEGRQPKGEHPKKSGQQPVVVTMAQLSELIGEYFEDINDVEAWVESLRHDHEKSEQPAD